MVLELMPNYDLNTPLQRGEEVKEHYEPSRHSSLATAYVLAGFVFFLGVVPSLFLGLFGILVAVPVLMVVLLIISGPEVTVRGTDFYITNQRVIKEFQFLTARSRAVKYNRITHIAPKSGILDRIFGAGSIDIKTAGSSGTDVKFKHIQNWKEAERSISQYMNQGNTRPAAQGGAPNQRPSQNQNNFNNNFQGNNQGRSGQQERNNNNRRNYQNQ